MHLTHPQVMILAERVPADGVTLEQERDGTIIYTGVTGHEWAITPRGDVKLAVDTETYVCLMSNDPDAVRKLMAN